MEFNLSFEETRVLGALIEKEKTTPEQYPMSLNALVNACNQKTNRDPVVNYEEMDVQNILDGLSKKYLISEDNSFGSRVSKFKHRFANSKLGGLQLSEQELAILSVMFLRGPQTPGELRSRTNRLCKFDNVKQTEEVMQALVDRSDGPFIVQLDRVPGQRERRYAHLFSGKVKIEQEAPASSSREKDQSGDLLQILESRIEALEKKVTYLETLK